MNKKERKEERKKKRKKERKKERKKLVGIVMKKWDEQQERIKNENNNK